jgi:hypothetical protein
MRKMLVLTALVLFGATMAGCKYCDRLRRGSLTQPWNAPTMPYCESCTTCAPETPCGVCESCASGSSITTTTTKAPMLPSPGQ